MKRFVKKSKHINIFQIFINRSVFSRKNYDQCCIIHVHINVKTQSAFIHSYITIYISSNYTYVYVKKDRTNYNIFNNVPFIYHI